MMALDTPKPELSLEDAVKSALSGSGIGDTSNNFNGVRMSLEIPEFWPKIKSVKTYEEYIRNKYERRPDIADRVLKESDKVFVANYDVAVAKINDAIGMGVGNEEQAQKVQLLCDEARKVVADLCGTIERN